MSTDTTTRLNKFISDSGFCSRREADQYIEENRVTINGKDAKKGATVKAGDKVAVDGEPIKTKKPSDRGVYIAFNKPTGITTTTDSKDKKNIIDFIGFPKRIFPIGRLDNASEGLIFLTNDGDIVNKILRADNNHEKEYVVMVDKPITDDFVKQMSNGVRLFEGITKPCEVKQQGHKVFKIVLTQGLNRQIRRMCEALNYKVTALKRVRIMTVTLGDLPVGHWRHLTLEEMKSINQLVASSSKTQEASTKVKKTVKEPKPSAEEEYEALLSEEEFGVKVHQVKKPKPEPVFAGPRSGKAPFNPKAKTARKPAAAAASETSATSTPERKRKPAGVKNMTSKKEHVSGKTERSPKGSLAARNPKAKAARKPKPATAPAKRGTRGGGRK
ncbi:23S rRNA pseudouridine(2604) synthase RluF [Rufibacter sp. LB8]|uniref:23S rRNA pseudouridine(2604) synthase RluF n=1 Tax=Rufibacter sp. LB8 TaxID=2777781 RepID=UPI00178C4B22|nr:23S rRNA pseudouridine(2604) synthase RluF [Rufibacter sp. LB8]